MIYLYERKFFLDLHKDKTKTKTMKIIINTFEKTITFSEGEWADIIEYLEMNPDFRLIDERGLLEPVKIDLDFPEFELPIFPIYPSYPVYPGWPNYPIFGEPHTGGPVLDHTILCGDQCDTISALSSKEGTGKTFDGISNCTITIVDLNNIP